LVDDADGTKIEGIFYTKVTPLFYDKVEEGRTYMIKKADVTHANKRFTSIDHDYCLIFKEQSEFEAIKVSVNEKLGADKSSSKN
jgi:replication factor A1